jgi:hypothetical protein
MPMKTPLSDYLGQRAPNLDPECNLGRAWAEYDALLARIATLEVQVKAADEFAGDLQWLANQHSWVRSTRKLSALISEKVAAYRAAKDASHA